LFQNELFDVMADSSDRTYFFLGDVVGGAGRWSKSAVTFFGLSGEYIDDMNGEWVPKIHPDDRNRYLLDFEKMITGESEEHNVQYRVTNKFGKYIWVECRGRIMKDALGGPGIFAGVLTCLDNRNKYDALTGLYTAHEFYNRDISNENGYFLLLGIDDFRNIVSSYGYTYADSILVVVAKILEQITGDRSKIYRLSGDEFIIAYTDSSQYEIMLEFCHIKTALDGIGEFKGHIITLNATAGAIAYPSENKQIEDYLNDLENSLEIAKEKYRGTVVFYDEEVAQMQMRRKNLRDDLVQSVKNDFKGFELYYQPLVDNTTGKISGCESLLRWKGETIKDSYPGEFIPVLEDIGYIRDIGSWVMETAIDQLKDWEEKYNDIKVSFNISYRQFMDENFADRFINKVKEAGINPGNLIAELTESCRIDNPASLAEMFIRIREVGVQVALDDFGTAYASMELLKVLPANYIKVEHLFVRELAKEGHGIDHIIIENIIGLCKRLGYTSVIEGVENEQVEHIVKKLGPDYLQGYYYSKPVCREEFEEMLERDRGIR